MRSTPRNPDAIFIFRGKMSPRHEKTQMDWHSLGHATWLAEVDRLRLLFDPLLEDLHHGGVFEVHPKRHVHAEALEADFIFVSHRHPDHFDLRSLKRLAELDRESVVVTSDELVASCARRLGFKTTRVVPAGTRIDLDGPRVITTPSAGASDPEWGAVVIGQEGAVYNQIDTSLGTASDVRRFFDEALGRKLTMGLVRWQPLLEVEAMTAGPIGFPFRGYADELARAAALDATVLVPSAAGTRHTGPYAFMNRLVYPITQARFLEDVAARAPSSRALRATTGATYRVRGDDVEVALGGASHLVEVGDATPNEDEARLFRPFEIPPIVDPGERQDEPRQRNQVHTWLERSLSPALAAIHPSTRYVLEVVYPSGAIEVRSFHRGTITLRDDVDWDVRCAVAGSLLTGVIEGRRHWGELLLGGMLRGSTRAYEVDVGGLRALPLQPLFVYESISYEQSVIRALESELNGFGVPSPRTPPDHV